MRGQNQYKLLLICNRPITQIRLKEVGDFRQGAKISLATDFMIILKNFVVLFAH